jgi:phage protein D
MDKDERIKELEEENKKLKEHLKKYTAPSYKKAYYEKNKEQILEKMKSNPTSPEKRKEYARRAYLNKKEKMKDTQNNENI